MVGMEAFSEKLGLLTRKEKDWLLGNIDLPKAYEYRLRSGIRKKLRILIEFELPLLSGSRLLEMCSNQYYYHQKEPAMGLGWDQETGSTMITQALVRQNSWVQIPAKALFLCSFF